MVDTEGIGWREAIYTQLKPVTRQRAATVWTVSRDGMKQLVTELTKNPATQSLQSPKVTSFNGVPATIQHRNKREFVSQVAWNGEKTASAGARDGVRVGWHTTMIGRALDQGVLVQIVFEDTAVRAVHHVNVNGFTHFKHATTGKSARDAATRPSKCDVVKASAEADAGPEVCCEEAGCFGPEAGCQLAQNNDKDVAVQKVVLGVPEIDTREVLGEWLIPHGDVLLVSFGAYTVADKDGKAVVRERMAFVEANAIGGPLAVNVPRRWVPAPPTPEIPPAPMPKIGMPTPVMPNRSFPQSVHADGTPADLPPLPADETEPKTPSSESSQPMPSPQTKKTSPPKPANDSGANKAEFAQPKSQGVMLPGIFMPHSSGGFQFLLPIKPLTFKLPFGQKLEFEVFGRIVPDAETH
jgi:hypothetical protein